MPLFVASNTELEFILRYFSPRTEQKVMAYQDGKQAAQAIERTTVKKMEKQRVKQFGHFIELFKNAKFIIFNIVIFVILGFAVISGDGKKIVLNLYEDLTGHKYETYSPVEDYSHGSYIILKDKFFRERNSRINNVDVGIIKKSDMFYKYRVALNGEYIFYKVTKKSNGIWHIMEEK